MSRPVQWQKSSFSSEGATCLEIAAPDATASSLLFRESEDPDVVLTTTAVRMRALLGLARRELQGAGREL